MFLDSMRLLAERIVLRLGLYDPVRSLYQAAFNRSYRNHLRERQQFFAPFIPRKGLVFDIGANHGDLTLLFTRCGARVVAVEPNPPLAAKLRARFPLHEIIEAAVSDQPGRATLTLGTESYYSTIDNRWKPVVAERGRLSDRTVDVACTTLDALIARMGVPVFIKLDVEGHELAALRGLTHAVNAVYFEYQSPLLADADVAMTHLEHLAAYDFGLEVQGGMIRWGDRCSTLGEMRERAERGIGSGDVLARRRISRASPSA